MRKLGLLFFSLLVLFSCKEEPLDVEVIDPEKIEIRGTISAVSDEGERANYSWDANADRIGFFSGTQTDINFCYTAFASTDTTRLTAIDLLEEMTRGENGTKQLYAYFPYNATYENMKAIPVSLPAIQQGSVNSVNHLKKSLVFYACNSTGTDGRVLMEFKSAAGLLKLNISSNTTIREIGSFTLRSIEGEALAYGEGVLNILDGTVSGVGGFSDNITFKLSQPISISGTPESLYFAVMPGHAGKDLELIGHTSGSDIVLGTVTIPSSGITAGNMLVVSLGHEKEEIQAEDLSIHGTANTYLVNAPSTTYKFKATVKGNGLARSYTVTFNGQQVEQSYSTSDLLIEPISAGIVWYNTPKTEDGWVDKSPVLLGSVFLDEDYVYFSTPDTFVPGNVLLAVYDNNNEILWSWNIWAVEEYDYNASAKKVGRYTMMDRNLGAIRGKEAMDSDLREATWAVGNYYQWGRKDPFPAAADYSLGSTANDMEWGIPTYTPIESLKKSYTYTGHWSSDNLMYAKPYNDNVYSMQDKGHGTGFTIDEAIEVSIKYPYLWVGSGTGLDSHPGSNYMWMLYNNSSSEEASSTKWRYLWGSTNGIENEKSIYDPCPPGWKVPTGDVFIYALGDVVPSSNNYGFYSPRYDLFFPSAGQRQAGFSGSRITGYSSGGEVMVSTATVTHPTTPTRTSSASKGITSHNSYAGAGYQIRCVREDIDARAADGNQSGARAVLVGNSITRTWPVRGRAAFFTENNYVAKGIDGQTSWDVLGRFYNDVLMLDPECVVIAAGTNDMAENNNYHVSNEDIFNQIKMMAELAADYGASVVIASLFPTNDMWWKSEEWKAANNHKLPERILAVNVMLKSYAASRGFEYVDYHTALKDDDNNLKLEYSWTTSDRVHPNYDGFAVMEPLLKAAVDKALYNPNKVDAGTEQLENLDRWKW